MKKNKFSSKISGFTLIELLIVVALLAIITTAVLVMINPIEKINQANDSKVQSDIAQIVGALQSYATSHDGQYPTTAEGLALLTTSDELSVIPKPPSGYIANYYYDLSGGVARVHSDLKAKKYGVGSYWVWCSTSGQIGTTTLTGCPL